MTDPKNLTEGFAFVAADSVPKRDVGGDRLGAFREAQAIARREAGEQVAKGLLSGKALTDNTVYSNSGSGEEAVSGRNEAVKAGSRAKALVAPVLAEGGQRPALSVSGDEDAGYRWFIVAKPIE